MPIISKVIILIFFIIKGKNEVFIKGFIKFLFLIGFIILRVFCPSGVFVGKLEDFTFNPDKRFL